MSSLRGFEERSILGDSGTSLRLEGWAPAWSNYGLQFIGFIDLANVTLEDAQLGEDDDVSPASVGLGLRWSWKQQLSLNLDFGSITEGVGDQEDGDSKTHFSLIYRY
jgi:hemolysin activation/secretion protein